MDDERRDFPFANRSNTLKYSVELQVVTVFIIKSQHLQNISDDPNRPAVHSFAVGLLSQNLRSCNDEMIICFNMARKTNTHTVF